MERWRFKSILKKILIFSGTYIAINFLFISFSDRGEDLEYKLLFLVLSIIISIIPVAILGIIYFITNFLKRRNDYKGSYYRDLKGMYPPAILSYLLDDCVEKKEDILATILYLSLYKFLNIEKINDRLVINVIASEADIQTLCYHEEYVINSLKERKKIDFKKFYEKVVYDCEINKLIRKKESSLIKFFITIRDIIALIAFIGLGIAFKFPNLWTFLFFIIFAIAAYIGKFVIKTHDRTSKGIEFTAKAKMLKNYIKDYTLLNENDYSHMELVDDYIPYALSLGEADKIEEIYLGEHTPLKDIIGETDLIDEFMNMY